MTTATFSTFFALLAVAAGAATVVVVALWITVRMQRPGSGAARAVSGIADSALSLAALVAVVCTLGSLYYSLIAHYQPCELCWYQRICMYPLAVVLTIAAFRRDRSIWRYALPIAAIGAVIAAYHTQLQAFPKQTTFCNLYNPCTVRYVWEFGFVSLPFMALAGFAFVIVMLGLTRSIDGSRRSSRNHIRLTDEQGPDRDGDHGSADDGRDDAKDDGSGDGGVDADGGHATRRTAAVR